MLRSRNFHNSQLSYFTFVRNPVSLISTVWHVFRHWFCRFLATLLIFECLFLHSFSISLTLFHSHSLFLTLPHSQHYCPFFPSLPFHHAILYDLFAWIAFYVTFYSIDYVRCIEKSFPPLKICECSPFSPA